MRQVDGQGMHGLLEDSCSVVAGRVEVVAAIDARMADCNPDMSPVGEVHTLQLEKQQPHVEYNAVVFGSEVAAIAGGHCKYKVAANAAMVAAVGKD